MAKLKKVYFCTDCGYETPKWLGKCPACGAWNTIAEHTVAKESSSPARVVSVPRAEACKVQDIAENQTRRIDTGNKELNRVLGGGIVPGSLILLGGEPGIGKSTLVLQTVLRMKGRRVLYVSGEESARQIKLRADRLRIDSQNLKISSETNMTNIISCIYQEQPDILIVDSVQTMFNPDISPAPGSVSQIRDVAATMMRIAKEESIATFLVGHVTKEGSIAGPKMLEHIVDTVLQFEGDQHYVYRILRAQKNRFGSTSELGIFQMQQDGLREVVNPSELLLSKNREGLSGIAIAAAVEGVRPLLREVQALVASAAYGTPQRSSTGFDGRRLNMLLAVLEKRVGFKLMQKDVFVNIAGGLRVNDPAIDLAVLAAVLSSNMDIALDAKVCLTGEVGLAGEIRPVNRIDQRIREAEKLGFEQIIIPRGQKYNTLGLKIKVVEVSRVVDAFRILIKH